MMANTDRRRASTPEHRDRVGSTRSARSFSLVLAAGVLIAVSAGCGRVEVEPPHLDQWPMATAMTPLAQITGIAWASPRERAVLEGSWSNGRIAAPGPIRAISRMPELEFQVHAGAPIRSGFLVYHDTGVIHVDTEGEGSRPVPLAAEAGMPTVRAATCLTPHQGDTGEVVALITGGEAPARTPAGEAEPPPWVSSAEVRLAWMQGERLVIGSPEPLAGTNPWRLRAGQFAGERDNLLVCVYNEAPFDDVTRRRPWIYRVTTDDAALPRLEPRWRGTSLSRPFRDATFGDFTGEGRGEIAALEVTRDGGRVLTAYRFQGFGLEGLAPSATLPEVEDRLEVARWTTDAADELVLRTRDGRFLFYTLHEEPAQLRAIRTLDGPAAVLGWTVTSASSNEPGELICVLPGGDVWRANSHDRSGQGRIQAR